MLNSHDEGTRFTDISILKIVLALSNGIIGISQEYILQHFMNYADLPTLHHY